MANRKDAERQVDELQTLVAALNAQIQGMQVQLEVREKEARDYSRKVEEYRAKESAIVSAMTDTQENCAKRIAEADAQAKYIITSAEEKALKITADAQLRLGEAEDKAKEIESEAVLKAEKIISDAQAEAENKLEKAERETEGLFSRLNGFRRALEEASAQARENAENFDKALLEVYESTQIIHDQNKDVSAIINDLRSVEKSTDENADEPFAPVDYDSTQKGAQALYKSDEKSDQANYESASQFLHGMYKLEGRDVPSDEETAGEQPMPGAKAGPEQRKAYEPEEERVWTVDEIISNTKIEPESEQVNEIPEGDIDIDSLLDEIMD